MPTLQNLREVVEESLDRASNALQMFRLDEKLAKARSMVKDLPPFRRMHLGYGEQSWSAILFVDLRSSTARAKEHGVRDTYLTMHALLPALAFMVGESSGYVVGFRGDGLFAAFGLGENGKNPQDLDRARTLSSACQCGQWMLEGLEVVNELLVERECVGRLALGVGVDVGDIIVTRIGFREMDEVTAYGNAVNRAAKLSGIGSGSILISDAADRLFPTTKEGRVTTHPVKEDPNARRVVYPVRLLQPGPIGVERG
jgi:class 3 adenylate cyclase